ncbi:hypothetical protein SAMN05660443_2926 [Marinospirillum celere]|uniref:DUF2231 domain-containing protein n=2 Tax=Marinospirillum celere TaxID=1122252 RepID=A0A1I1JY58_9GAMM|nr:hypothetical protein SAMN05660443_2926 [Marinospirillum celere]
MSGIHAMLVHFPIAFWALASLMIIVGALMQGHWAQLAKAGLLPVLILGLLGGIAGMVSGWLVWPADANLYSPLTRNHLLMSFWAFGIYAVVTALVWRYRDLVFEGAFRWAMLVLALMGGLFFAISGTLGGHLAGSPTPFSDLLGAGGWTVYETFYVPDWVLVVILILAVASAVAGFTAKTRS